MIFCILPLSSQEISDNSVKFEYRGESRASFSAGENTPFWFVSNIHGLGSPKFNNGYIRGELFKHRNELKKFDWGFGIDLTGAWNLPAPFAIRQLYGEIHFKEFQVTLGSKNYESLYNDRHLSSGDLLFSGNSMAIPQLRVGTNGFAPFWGTKGWFSVNAYMAYGFLTDTKWIENWVAPRNDRAANVLFCARGLWFRAGNQKEFPLTLDIGIEMATQFGGTIYKDGHEIKMPTRFKDWVKAFIPYHGNSTNEVLGEQTNVQGNMNGEYNVALSWKPSSWKITGYFEHYFEDQSQMTFEYGLWKDALWGLQVELPQNRFITKFVYEYIGTSDQTGAVYHDSTSEVPEQISGRDGYYTHSLYGAWQNWGMTIGTPLAISPLYNRDHHLTIYNNRFIANHFGLEGHPLSCLYWRTLLTFSRNWGTYIRPLPKRMDNFSGLIEITGTHPKLEGWFAKAAIAWDKGVFLGNNFGGLIGIGYSGNFSISRH